MARLSANTNHDRRDIAGKPSHQKRFGSHPPRSLFQTSEAKPETQIINDERGEIAHDGIKKEKNKTQTTNCARNPYPEKHRTKKGQQQRAARKCDFPHLYVTKSRFESRKS